MLDLYISNKNAIVGLESALRIAISNANNFNTSGYKYMFSTFTTMYTEAISSGSKTTNPMELGSGMTLGATSTDFSQGSISIGTSMDIAINGEGFFMVSSNTTDFDSNATKVFTRAGSFQTNASNTHIVDDYGRKVFGFPVNAQGNITSTVPVAIETNSNNDLGFQDGGILVKDATSDNPVPIYKIALTTFQNKEGLIATAGGGYKRSIASGDAFNPGIADQSIAANSETTYGSILSNSLESSNVDIAKVALDMNLLNRGFAAVQAVIDDVTKILNEVIKTLKG